MHEKKRTEEEREARGGWVRGKRRRRVNREEEERNGKANGRGFVSHNAHWTQGYECAATAAKMREETIARDHGPFVPAPPSAIDVAMTRESEKLGINRTFAMKRNPIAIASSGFRWLSNSRP